MDGVNIKTIISRIKNLSDKEKLHILSILQKNNVEYAKNSNGYFFNLEKVDKNILNKLSKCVDLIETNRDLISALDKKRDSHMEYYKSLIESKLNQTIKSKQEIIINKLLLSDTFNFKDHINKKEKSKKRNEQCEDIDILMKEFNKKPKYKKDGIYFRINQILNRSKHNNKRVREVKDTDDSDNRGLIDSLEDIDEDIDEEIDEVDIVDEETEEIEDEEVEVEDIDEDIDENIEDEDIDESEDEEDEEDTTYEECQDTSDIVSERTCNKKVSQSSFEFYKNILQRQHGYTFDYDKNVQMKFQKYIT